MDNNIAVVCCNKLCKELSIMNDFSPNEINQRFGVNTYSAIEVTVTHNCTIDEQDLNIPCGHTKTKMEPYL